MVEVKEQVTMLQKWTILQVVGSSGLCTGLFDFAELKLCSISLISPWNYFPWYFRHHAQSFHNGSQCICSKEFTLLGLIPLWANFHWGSTPAPVPTLALTTTDMDSNPTTTSIKQQDSEPLVVKREEEQERRVEKRDRARELEAEQVEESDRWEQGGSRRARVGYENPQHVWFAQCTVQLHANCNSLTGWQKLTSWLVHPAWVISAPLHPCNLMAHGQHPV